MMIRNIKIMIMINTIMTRDIRELRISVANELKESEEEAEMLADAKLRPVQFFFFRCFLDDGWPVHDHEEEEEEMLADAKLRPFF